MSEKYGKYKQWVSQLEVGKNACYRCRKNGGDNSGDNFHYYGEGLGGVCFSGGCGFKILSDEALSEINADEIDLEEELQMTKKFSRVWWKEFRKQLTFDCKLWRGIRTETNKFYGVMYEFDTESEAPKLKAQYCPTTYEKRISGIKSRVLPKDFHSIGIVGKQADLFGQHKFKDAKGKFVVVTAGEIDCLSGFQMLEDYRANSKNKDSFDPIPVVSPTAGEGAVNQIRNQYDWLDRFEKIIICYDNDKAGKKALDKISQVLPKGKMYVMDITRNDTNEYIWDGNKVVNHSNQWISAFWGATKYTPSGIVGSGALSAKVREYFQREKIPLPPFLHDLNEMTRGGFPLKQIINFASASGTGKSTIVDELAYYWTFNSPYKLGVLSLEAECGKYGVNLLSRHIGRKLELCRTPEEAMAILDSPEVIEAEKELWVDENDNHRIHLIEDRGMDIEHVQRLISELIIKCGCQLIIIDPIQDVLDKVSNTEQADFADWLKDMTKTYDVSFILVNHVRKNSNNTQANSTGANLNEEDIRGSAAIFNSAAFNILMMRNKEAEDHVEKNTTYVKVTKARGPGDTGWAGELYYDNETHIMKNRKVIPGMPIGRPPKPDRDGEVQDDRPRVGKQLNPVNSPSQGPMEPEDIEYDPEDYVPWADDQEDITMLDDVIEDIPD